MSRECAKLLGVAVHELRNPISVIAGYARMLGADRTGAASGRQRQIIRDIQTSTRELVELISELSDLANLESGSAVINRQEVVVGDLLKQVAALRAREKAPVVELKSKPGEVTIEGDPVRLRAAFTAILSTLRTNAADGDKVIIEHAVRRQAGRPFLTVMAGSEAAVRALAERRPRSLVRFSVSGGRGAIASLVACEVIRAHGGQVWMRRRQRRPRNALIELPLMI